jgi:hypothetical protein
MSNLQIGLLILGVFILAALLIHGSWTSRKSVPRQAEPLLTQQELEALGVDASDPQFLKHAPSTGFADELMLAQADYSSAAGAAASVGSSAKVARAPLMDPLIDVLTLIELESPVYGEAAIQTLPSSRRVGTKIFQVEGLNADSGEWEPLSYSVRYSAFQTGVQLANRGGALNEIEFSEFVMKTQAFADHFNASPEFPDMLEVISRARELDQFATEHDAQLSFTIQAQESAWSPGYIHQHAAQLGFVAGSVAGRLVIASDVIGNPPILSLIYDSRAALADDPKLAAITHISLLLDVTHVASQLKPFPLMCSVAQQLAADMDGLITDDNGQPLTQESMNIIERDLGYLYSALEHRDLAAGSLQARRLFS